MSPRLTGSVLSVPFRFLLRLIVPWSSILWLLTACGQAPTEERVVAFVNGRPITQVEFEAEWNDLPEATRARYEKEGGKPRLLSEVITRELLLQEARKQGLDQNDQIRDRARRYKEKLMLDELLKDRIKTKIELTKEELDAYYEKHARQLLTPLKVRVSLMLLP
ncbi:MAG TPA: SurA N-terminal domain-containing protein, partial [Nitrospira sp.]|nr:SurA N-terminal domain-containing protein [Nitrospira sp.]